MTNLLKETKEDMAAIGKTPDEVLWVGSADGILAISWEAFCEISDCQYSSTYGPIYVPLDLVVRFIDGTWLRRSEYDGLEGWQYIVPPQKQPHARSFAIAVSDAYRPGRWGGYDGLQRLNEAISSEQRQSA